MAKFHGAVGYGESVETDGVFEDVITERLYFGDVIRNSVRFSENQRVNDDLTIGNSISIVADGHAYNHVHAIRFVVWEGAAWKVTEVTLERPRLILRLGGVYNGPRSA